MVLGFIPVRGGSKSIPLKNIKDLAGHPLVYWTTKALSEAKGVDRVVVATDSEEIRKVVVGFGLPKVEVYMRDATNAQDNSSTESVMLEYLPKANLAPKDLFVLCQATSPLTGAADVDAVLRPIQEGRADSTLTAVLFKRFLWERTGKPINYDPGKRPRRQEFAGCLMENGALYATPVQRLKETGLRISGTILPVEMHEDSAYEIDEPSDWIIVEGLLKKRLSETQPAGPRAPVRLFLTDVDGVLTDGGMYYSENGDELKKFNTKDGLGLRLLQEAGVRVGIVTGEDTQLVARRATKLKLDYLFQGVRDKASVVEKLIAELGIDWSEVAYIGDDVNDLGLLKVVGWSACPADAVPDVRRVAGTVLSLKGGEGCVREFCTKLSSFLPQGTQR